MIETLLTILLSLLVFTLMILVNLLLIFGVKKATQYGMVLYPLTAPFESWKAEREANENFDLAYGFVSFITKPLYNCVYCMSSFWGVLFVFSVASTFGFWENINFIWLVAYAFALCGAISILGKYLESLDRE